MNYSTFMNGCKKAGITLNRKMLSEIAINDASGFTAIAEKAKATLDLIPAQHGYQNALEVTKAMNANFG